MKSSILGAKMHLYLNTVRSYTAISAISSCQYVRKSHDKSISDASVVPNRSNQLIVKQIPKLVQLQPISNFLKQFYFRTFSHRHFITQDFLFSEMLYLSPGFLLRLSKTMPL